MRRRIAGKTGDLKKMAWEHDTPTRQERKRDYTISLCDEAFSYLRER